MLWHVTSQADKLTKIEKDLEEVRLDPVLGGMVINHHQSLIHSSWRIIMNYIIIYIQQLCGYSHSWEKTITQIHPYIIYIHHVLPVARHFIFTRVETRNDYIDLSTPDEYEEAIWSYGEQRDFPPKYWSFARSRVSSCSPWMTCSNEAAEALRFSSLAFCVWKSCL